MPDANEMGEAMAKLGEVLTALPVKMKYALAQGYIDGLRKLLVEFTTTTPTQRYTMLDTYAQMLDALELSIKQHEITWEHQRAEANETS